MTEILVYRGESIWTSVWLDDGAWREGTGHPQRKTDASAPDKPAAVSVQA